MKKSYEKPTIKLCDADAQYFKHPLCFRLWRKSQREPEIMCEATRRVLAKAEKRFYDTMYGVGCIVDDADKD